jgi:hypothetical protein
VVEEGNAISAREAPRVPWGRGLLAAAGLAALGYGIHGLLTAARATHPTQAARWLIGGVLAHDLIVAPVAALVGLALTRLVRAPYRAVVQGALLVSSAVLLSSLPLWRGYGGAPGNPSVDPLPYGRNLALVLGAIWLAAGALIAARATRARGDQAGHDQNRHAQRRGDRIQPGQIRYEQGLPLPRRDIRHDWGKPLPEGPVGVGPAERAEGGEVPAAAPPGLGEGEAGGRRVAENLGVAEEGPEEGS